MSGRKKILIAILCVVAGFSLAAAVMAPRLVQIDRYRPEVIAFLDQKTGHQVEIGRLALSLFPHFAIRVDKFEVENPPGFPKGACMAVHRINALLSLRALLDRQIVIRRLTIDHPVFTFAFTPEGQWNCQLARSSAGRLPPGDPPLFRFRDISNLDLDQGEITLQQLASGGQPVSGPIAAGGVSGHLSDVNFMLLDQLVSGGPRGAQALQEAGTAREESGRLTASWLRLGRLQASGCGTRINILPRELRLNGIECRVAGGRVKAGLQIDIGVSQPRFHSTGQVSGIQLATLLAQFPSAKGKMTGTLDGQWSLSGNVSGDSGVVASEQGRGSVSITKGRWRQLHLNPDLLKLLRLARLGPASGDFSAFSSITANWLLSEGVVSTSNLSFAGSNFRITGAGTLQLTKQRLVHLDGNLDISGQSNLLTNFLAAFSGATFRRGQLHLPFVVGGTLQHPTFRLKTGLSPALRQPPPRTSGAAPKKHSLGPAVPALETEQGEAAPLYTFSEPAGALPAAPPPDVRKGLPFRILPPSIVLSFSEVRLRLATLALIWAAQTWQL